MGSASLTTSVATHVSQNTPTMNLNGANRLGTRTGGPGDAQAFVYWRRPFPLKATVTSAKIYLYTSAMAESVTHTFTFQRLAAAFSASKVTWNTRPTSLISGTKTVTKTGVLPAGQEWILDITDWMQTISNGGNWYGVRILENEALIRAIYSEIWTDTAMRPRLEVTWSDAPATPSSLSPSGGRAVGTPKPVVRASYLDVSGSTALQAVQVQINATDVWTAPSFDSGTVLTSVPDLDLSTTAYGGLADGATTFWRIRFQDAAGLWSPWSASTSFSYDAKGVLTLNSPAADYGDVQRTNFASNPKATTLTNWQGAAGTGGTFTTAAAQTTSPPPGLSSYWRVTYTVTSTSVSGGLLYNNQASGAHDFGLDCIPGDVRSLGFYVRTSAAQRVYIYCEFMNGTTSIITNSGGFYDLAANTWTWCPTGPYTAPTSTTSVRPRVYLGTGSHAWTAGETMDVSGLTVVEGSSYPTAPFDGDKAASGGLSYRWTGTANLSASEEYIPLPAADLMVNDNTPPVIWTFTGETQAAYQVQISHKVNGQVIEDWNSGKLSSSVSSITVPSGKINEHSGTVYTFRLRVWDNKQRESTPGSPVYQEIVNSFTYKPGTASPVTAFTATAQDPRPAVVLSWSRGTAPDRYNISRNGKVIAGGLDPDDLLVTGTTYTYTDPSPSPKRSLVYRIQAVVNNIASKLTPTATVTVQSKGIWLRSPDTGLEVCIVGREDREMTLGETSVALQSIAPNANKVAINQSLGGLEGRIEGEIRSVYGRTAQQWRDDFLQMRALRVKRFWLTVGDYTFQVIAQNFSYTTMALPVPSFRVGFDFYQQNSVNSVLMGS
jgi:hypothetical protein